MIVAYVDSRVPKRLQSVHQVESRDEHAAPAQLQSENACGLFECQLEIRWRNRCNNDTDSKTSAESSCLLLSFIAACLRSPAGWRPYVAEWNEQRRRRC